MNKAFCRRLNCGFNVRTVGLAWGRLYCTVHNANDRDNVNQRHPLPGNFHSQLHLLVLNVVISLSYERNA